MYRKVCGEKIKKAIKNAGFTQQKFGKKINTEQSMISQWIIGKRNPSLKSLEKIALATGKPLNFFLENSNFDSYNSANSTVIVNEKDYEQMQKENELLRRELEIIKKEKELILEKLKK